MQPSETATVTQGRYGPRLPRSMASAKEWLSEHHMTLMSIADTPHSVALGSAIGVFFGFTPLYPLKTLLSILVAWAFRCNKIAAAIAVTLHDVLILAMPAIYFAEYKLGCWMLHRPPPARIRVGRIGFHEHLNWHVFSQWVWPALIGSLFLAIPGAIIAYVAMRMLVSRARSCAGSR
jgi:uncharacterized protein (DUF2062 family)